MRLLKAWGPFAVLLALALAAGLAAGTDSTASSLPSVENKGPHGLAVLKLWLQRQGVDVRAHHAPLTELPSGVGTIVVAAPTQRPITEDELTALLRFVSGGGTLIYLAPRGDAQRAIAEELELTKASGPEPASELSSDLGGATVTVRTPGGLLAGVKRLRVSADATLSSAAAHTFPATSDGALWVQRRGAGEVWVAAGPDLAENMRLELEDNAAFWANVGGKGPVLFDEGHFVAAEAPPLTTNLLASMLQFGFLALVFVAARGARLGPPRPSLGGAQRSAMEYVRAMAALTRDAKVDGELLARLRADLRAWLKERLGLSLALPVDEVIDELAKATTLGRDDLETVFRSADFLETSRAVARLEAALGVRL